MFCEIYDLATGRWSRGPALPTARHHAGAAARSGGRRTAFRLPAGGRTELSLDVVERFEAGGDEQAGEQALSMPLGTGALAVVAAHGSLVAVGGGDDAEGWVTPATWWFEPRTQHWRRLADLRIPRHGHAAAAVGDEIYVFGGAPCPGYGRTDSVERLTR